MPPRRGFLRLSSFHKQSLVLRELTEKVVVRFPFCPSSTNDRMSPITKRLESVHFLAEHSLKGGEVKDPVRVKSIVPCQKEHAQRVCHFCRFAPIVIDEKCRDLVHRIALFAGTKSLGTCLNLLRGDRELSCKYYRSRFSHLLKKGSGFLVVWRHSYAFISVGTESFMFLASYSPPRRNVGALQDALQWLRQTAGRRIHIFHRHSGQAAPCHPAQARPRKAGFVFDRIWIGPTYDKRAIARRRSSLRADIDLCQVQLDGNMLGDANGDRSVSTNAETFTGLNSGRFGFKSSTDAVTDSTGSLSPASLRVGEHKGRGPDAPAAARGSSRPPHVGYAFSITPGQYRRSVMPLGFWIRRSLMSNRLRIRATSQTKENDEAEPET